MSCKHLQKSLSQKLSIKRLMIVFMKNAACLHTMTYVIDHLLFLLFKSAAIFTSSEISK